MKRFWFGRALVALAAMLSMLLMGQVAASAATFSDNFSGYTNGCWNESTTNGSWQDVFNGYGTQCVVASGAYKHLRQVPKTSTVASETHAALNTSVASFGNGTLVAEFGTNQQLRKNPNAWERPWLLWHYTDNLHFYYLVLKSNGWEIGKEDPAYPGAQQFLGSGSNYTWPVAGSWTHVEVSSVGTTFTVKATDKTGVLRTLFTYTDQAANASQYVSGKVGLYSEDASVDWGWVAVT
jgi:hypothetical protein